MGSIGTAGGGNNPNVGGAGAIIPLGSINNPYRGGTVVNPMANIPLGVQFPSLAGLAGSGATGAGGYTGSGGGGVGGASGGGASSGYGQTVQNAQNSANAANTARANQISGIYDSMYQNAQNMGGVLRTNLARQTTQQLGAADQSATSRGLRNTTVLDSLNRGINTEAGFQSQGIENTILQNLNQVLGQKAGFLNSITQQGPNAALYAELARAASNNPGDMTGQVNGQQGGQQGQQGGQGGQTGGGYGSDPLHNFNNFGANNANMNQSIVNDIANLYAGQIFPQQQQQAAQNVISGLNTGGDVPNDFLNPSANNYGTGMTDLLNTDIYAP